VSLTLSDSKIPAEPDTAKLTVNDLAYLKDNLGVHALLDYDLSGTLQPCTLDDNPGLFQIEALASPSIFMYFIPLLVSAAAAVAQCW
jgi:hypothetical protein